ncbi:MAG: hypothetical protein IKN91_08105 [Paludibacteraceae bacterium]|nr:hypothetical protein [Paludibacteraceae bacterium]
MATRKSHQTTYTTIKPIKICIQHYATHNDTIISIGIYRCSESCLIEKYCEYFDIQSQSVANAYYYVRNNTI